MRKYSLEDKQSKFSTETVEFSLLTRSHLENYYKNYWIQLEERKKRKELLESKLNSSSLLPEQCEVKKQQLALAETSLIRLRRIRLNVKSFELLKIIGRGASGEVHMVRMKGTDDIYAMKKLNKLQMLETDRVGYVKAEKYALEDNEIYYSNFSWVTRLYYSFQDRLFLYLIMEFVQGGDLMTQLIQQEVFTEDETRFYIAEIVAAIESIHILGYIHRDIKPDNVLIDASGHIKLADLGFCAGLQTTSFKNRHKLDMHDSEDQKREQVFRDSSFDIFKGKKRQKVYSAVGSPDYISPEIILSLGSDETCDWWSVGVIMFEMLFGGPPFSSESQEETTERILNWKQSFYFPESPEVSDDAKDLILGLVCDQKERLGRTGVHEIKQHPFFRGIDWNNLRSMKPPFIPNLSGPTDCKYFDEIPPLEQTIPLNLPELSRRDNIFRGFTFKSNHALKSRLNFQFDLTTLSDVNNNTSNLTGK